ncbi:acyl-CoA desaturase [Mycobacteroides abscessus]|nr:acyl-CoA desaturase [Mycobacteroides abscessus]SKU02531.1 fatty acid desaturase [Mycobacteroides abscessus subsp. massiliense]SKU11816.1 fatty acid desaturase [Mycobacteroides abscessus subsp. massiliense]
MTVNYERLLATTIPDPIAESDRSAAAPETPGAFPALQKEIRAAGLLDLRRGYYVTRITATVLIIVAAWALFFYIGASWWQLAVALLLAFGSAQAGLMGHDVGHHQVTRTRRTRELLGYLHINLLLGGSYEWWINHHNRHHSNPNHTERDTDIVRRKAIFTPAQASQPMSAARRFIIRRQEKIFFPMAILESLGLRVVSARAIMAGTVRRPVVESLLIATHSLLYFVAVFSTLPVWMGLAFVAVHQGATGLYGGLIFAPNHKGMPVRSDEEKLDWMTRQVITARNIPGGPLLDYLYGGLNYQIEHHLFPSMSQANLRKASPIVKAHCLAAGLPYHETSVVGAYTEILRHLRRVRVEAEPLLH